MLLLLGLSGLSGLAAPGCGRKGAPAKRDLCELAVKHVMALGAGQVGSGSAAAAPSKFEDSTIAVCRKEGLSQEQADCILATRTDGELAAVRSCPAIAARHPGWLVLAPTDSELKEIKDMLEPPVGPVTSAVAYRQLAGVNDTTCGLLDSGGLQCWGQRKEVPAGVFTQIGWRWHLCGLTAEGKLSCAPHFAKEDLAFLPTAPLSTFSEGQFHGCGIVKATGALTCWSTEGWLGDGNQYTPPAGKFTQVASSAGYSCALKADRSVACFGAAAPPPPKGPFLALAAMQQDLCGIRVDGTVACWGAGISAGAQLPEGKDGKLTQLSCGERHCCALREGGAVTCWGEADNGRLTAPAGTFTTVLAAGMHSCASGPAGTVCWGASRLGQTAVPQAAGDHAWAPAP